jgi:hypothetical protein
MTVTFMPRGHAAARRTFTVVLLCDTDQSRAKGLQGLRPLKPKEAALFVFDRPEAVTFWMGADRRHHFCQPYGTLSKSSHCQPGSHQFYGSSPGEMGGRNSRGSGIMVGDRVVIISVEESLGLEVIADKQ